MELPEGMPIRPTRENAQPLLFEELAEPDWKQMWWGMPEYTMGDASPAFKIVINFMTAEDVRDFAKASGIPVTTRSDSAWYPPQKPLTGDWGYTGPPTPSRYPICIPSKGRADNQLTGKWLDKMGVPYHFFVEETEADQYIKALGRNKVIVMPFHDLGQGSVPARNFIWEWAKAEGYARHWTVDDNIRSFARTNANRRLGVLGGGFFIAMEDFVDRYTNIAMAGPHHKGFVPDRCDTMGPFLLNSRVYSCILLDTSLPHRWRGRYNEDTDLSLRLLKDGYCTLLFRALLMDKAGTAVGAANGVGTQGKAMKGGNTDHVYNTGDYRRAFAESLKEQHPDVVEVVWKFNRWHHQVDYSPFRNNTPIMKPGITPTACNNEYGMRFVRLKRGEGATEG